MHRSVLRLVMNLKHLSNKTAHTEEVRCEGAVVRGVIPRAVCHLLLIAVAVFATFGNLPRVIVETHDGHDDHSTADSFQIVEHHDDDHHDNHLPMDDHDDGEHSHHHHHVEISSSLMIAFEAVGET